MSEPWLLAIDTATNVVVVAAGTPAGELIDARTFPAGHRHGSLLLATVDALVRDPGLALDALAGVVVGTGPGAFTGLRVGLATAKVVAHELGIALVGIPTAEALLAADPSAGTLLLPAGPHDRTIVARGAAPKLLAGDGVPEPPGTMAVDLAGRASSEALERGRQAVEELPVRLLTLGAERLRSGATDDVERLVPAYVSLPRGVTTDLGDGGVAWSRDPR